MDQRPLPIYASILQRIFGRFFKDIADVDHVYNPEADIPYDRRTYLFAGAVAACAGLCVRFASPVSVMNVFSEGIHNPSTSVSAMASLVTAFRYDQIAAFSTGAIRTMLSFKGLKKAGKLTAGWARIVGVFAGTTVVAGPGAEWLPCGLERGGFGEEGEGCGRKDLETAINASVEGFIDH